MNAPDAMEQRLIQVETVLMQLQHDLDQLNKAVLDQQGELTHLKGALDRLTATLEEGPAEPRNPVDERPPHY
jgi:uncharacterized coiled-coil protein SlyX